MDADCEYGTALPAFGFCMHPDALFLFPFSLLRIQMIQEDIGHRVADPHRRCRFLRSGGEPVLVIEHSRAGLDHLQGSHFGPEVHETVRKR